MMGCEGDHVIQVMSESRSDNLVSLPFVATFLDKFQSNEFESRIEYDFLRQLWVQTRAPCTPLRVP